MKMWLLSNNAEIILGAIFIAFVALIFVLNSIDSLLRESTSYLKSIREALVGKIKRE